MPAFTLQTGKVFNLLTLMKTGVATDGTAATSAARVNANQGNLCGRLKLRVLSGSGGNLHVTFGGNSTPSGTDFDMIMYPLDADDEAFMIRGNVIALSDIYLFASANATTICVAALPY